ncbi:hypothetical protein CDAR_198861 [Caerostris darwini]|uniref:Uncharacterized protein n=1 Tax=Caerostris darwini TaxID=1538125 RepID=A0AAV4T9E3_9ARAC|nr:hypothetical protein CDAR_198861 [Caerostris darwini]
MIAVLLRHVSTAIKSRVMHCNANKTRCFSTAAVPTHNPLEFSFPNDTKRRTTLRTRIPVLRQASYEQILLTSSFNQSTGREKVGFRNHDSGVGCLLVKAACSGVRSQ